MGDRRKSSLSGDPKDHWCVEPERCTIAEATGRGINLDGIDTTNPDGVVILFHDSKHPNDPPKVYTPRETAAFLLGVKTGEFDYLVDSAVFHEVMAAQS